MIKFYKISVIVEADSESEAEEYIDGIKNHFSPTTDLWRAGAPTELTKKEVKDFFESDEKTYEEMVEF